MATIKDVANLAGVSVSTVSVIINGKAEERKISSVTVKKVLGAIKDLNYQPSVSARRLRSNASKVYTVGIFWASDFRMAYLSRLISGIQSELLKTKIPAEIVICPYKENKLHLENRLYSLDAFNAVIIANTSEKDTEYIHKNPLQIPTILYNRSSDIYHTVEIDNLSVGRKAALHLISSGAKSIVMICQKNSSYTSSTKRSKSFYETCMDHNIEIDKNDTLFVDGSLSSGAEAAIYLIEKNKLPDAIFCDSDVTAQGLLHIFRKNNISVPNDVQVLAIGSGNPEISQYYNPSISVIDIPMEKMASKCLSLIAEIALNGLKKPIHVIYESPLIKRETTTGTML